MPRYRISRDLKERQEQMQAMDDTLDDISEKTTWHVTVWAGVQSVGLVLISFFQIYYLKSFFEVSAELQLEQLQSFWHHL